MPTSSNILVNSFNCLDPLEVLEQCGQQGIPVGNWFRKINSFRLPRGKQYGRGWFLMESVQAAALLSTPENWATFNDGENTVTLSNLALLSTKTLDFFPNNVRVVELADRRWFGRFGITDKRFNVRAAETPLGDETPFYHSDSLNVDTPWTWQQVLDQLWATLPTLMGASPQLPVFKVNPAIPAAPASSTPENLRFHGVPSWEAYFHVLDLLGFDLVCNRDGSFVLISLGESLNNIQDTTIPNVGSDIALHDGYATTTTAMFVPETVRVFFPNKRYDFQTEQDAYAVTGEDAWILHPHHHIDKTATDAGFPFTGAAGSVIGIHAPLPALYDSTGTLDNAAALDAYALDLAKRVFWSIGFADSYFHKILTGFRKHSPKADISGVAWYDIGDGCKTELISTPREMNPEGDVGELCNNPLDSMLAAESIGTPDLARPHVPHTRIIFGKLATALDTQDSAPLRVYWGSVSGANITWSTITGNITVSVFNPSDDLSYADESWVAAYFDYQVANWVVFPQGTAQDFKLFSLYESLDKGSDADAVVRDWSGAAWVDTGTHIQVFDSSRIGPGSSGDKGIAWNNPSSNRYEIITLERQNGVDLVPFMLEEAIERDGVANARIRTWAGGWFPIGALIGVIDWCGLGPAPAETNGVAWNNPDSGRYEIVTLANKSQVIYSAELYEKLPRGGQCQATLTVWNGNAGTWDATGQQVTVHDSYAEHGPGVSGERVVVQFDGDSSRYEVISVDKETKIVLFTLTDDCDSGGSASAVLREFNNGQWSDTQTAITVNDTTERGPASAEDYGIAILHPESDEYEVVTFERKDTSGLHFFVLNAMLSVGGSASATLREFDGGTNQWQSTGNVITVFDSGYLQGPAHTGCLGIAWFNNESGRYEVIDLRMDRLRMVRLIGDGPLVRGGATIGVPQNWDSNNNIWVDDFNLGQVPVSDPYFFGPALFNSRVWCVFSYFSLNYELVSVPSQGQFVIRATSNWQGAGNGEQEIASVQGIMVIGLNDTTPAHDANGQEINVTVNLPVVGWRAPNVRENDIITAALTGQGDFTCTSDYLDDPIGTVKMWVGNVAEVKRGWEIVEEAEGRFPVHPALSDEDLPSAPMQTAGEKDHTHEPYLSTDYAYLSGYTQSELSTAPAYVIIPPHPGFWTDYANLTIGDSADVDATGSIGGSGNVNTSTKVTGISIPQHAAHQHTVLDTGTITYTTGSGNVDVFVSNVGMGHGTTSENQNLSHVVSDPGHFHTVSIADIASALVLEDITIPGHSHSISPNPHLHLLPDLPHAPTSHAHAIMPFEIEITPNPHLHLLPPIPKAKHIPPCIGMYLIRRVD